MNTPPTIELRAEDLTPNGGTYCPNPKAGMAVVNNHPKVYLDLGHSDTAKCPYCGTVYQLKAGEHLDRAH